MNIPTVNYGRFFGNMGQALQQGISNIGKNVQMDIQAKRERDAYNQLQERLKNFKQFKVDAADEIIARMGPTDPQKQKRVKATIMNMPDTEEGHKQLVGFLREYDAQWSDFEANSTIVDGVKKSKYKTRPQFGFSSKWYKDQNAPFVEKAESQEMARISRMAMQPQEQRIERTTAQPTQEPIAPAGPSGGPGMRGGISAAEKLIIPGRAAPQTRGEAYMQGPSQYGMTTSEFEKYGGEYLPTQADLDKSALERDKLALERDKLKVMKNRAHQAARRMNQQDRNDFLKEMKALEQITDNQDQQLKTNEDNKNRTLKRIGEKEQEASKLLESIKSGMSFTPEEDQKELDSIIKEIESLNKNYASLLKNEESLLTKKQKSWQAWEDYLKTKGKIGIREAAKRTIMPGRPLVPLGELKGESQESINRGKLIFALKREGKNNREISELLSRATPEQIEAFVESKGL